MYSSAGNARGVNELADAGFHAAARRRADQREDHHRRELVPADDLAWSIIAPNVGATEGITRVFSDARPAIIDSSSSSSLVATW
jgi:hypothetical protein